MMWFKVFRLNKRLYFIARALIEVAVLKYDDIKIELVAGAPHYFWNWKNSLRFKNSKHIVAVKSV